jgi:uncharacterized protein with PQ loop repeat
MVELLGPAAAGWGVLMALSPLLQIRRMVIRQSSADVSLAYLIVLQLGFGLWVAYGLAAANPVVVLPNSMASIVGVVTILVAWRYRRPAASAYDHTHQQPEDDMPATHLQFPSPLGTRRPDSAFQHSHSGYAVCTA